MYSVLEYSCQAQVDEVVKSLGFKNTTFIQLPGYHTNWRYFWPPKPAADGVLEVTLPMSLEGKMAEFDVGASSHRVDNLR